MLAITGQNQSETIKAGGQVTVELVWGARGRGFESRRPDFYFHSLTGIFLMPVLFVFKGRRCNCCLHSQTTNSSPVLRAQDRYFHTKVFDQPVQIIRVQAQGLCRMSVVAVRM